MGAIAVLFDKRNRWLINIVMAVAVLSFLGIAVVAPFSEALRDRQQTGATPSPSGTAAARQAELEQQAKGYELVLQREPDNQTALRGLLETRIQSGDIQGTIEPLEKLAQLNPEQTEYTILLAQARQQTGDREGAAQAYRGILAKQPGDLNALQGLVNLMMQEGRPEAAIALLQDTLQSADQVNQVQPDSVDVTSVQLLLGQVYAEQDRFDEALAVYDEAIRGSATDFRPVLGKAIVLQTQGKTEEAKPLFDSAAALAPAQYKDQINRIATTGTAALTDPPTVADPAESDASASPDAPASPAAESPAPAAP